jgi:hypothetical protein
MKEVSPVVIVLVALVGTIIGALITAISGIIVFNLNRKHQLSLAALDRRFEALQKAYKMCNFLDANWAAREADRNDVQNSFIDYWNNNCLYLGKESRINLSETFKVYVRFGVEGVGNNIGKEFHAAKERTISALTEEMSLPSLGSKEVSNQWLERTVKTPAE